MVFRIDDANSQADCLLDFANLSERTGMKATPRAPVASVKNIKSGILKAAKYALALKPLKLALIKDVLTTPKIVPMAVAAINKKAAELIDNLVLARFKKRFICHRLYFVDYSKSDSKLV